MPAAAEAAAVPASAARGAAVPAAAAGSAAAPAASARRAAAGSAAVPSAVAAVRRPAPPVGRAAVRDGDASRRWALRRCSGRHATAGARRASRRPPGDHASRQPCVPSGERRCCRTAGLPRHPPFRRRSGGRSTPTTSGRAARVAAPAAAGHPAGGTARDGAARRRYPFGSSGRPRSTTGSRSVIERVVGPVRPEERIVGAVPVVPGADDGEVRRPGPPPVVCAADHEAPAAAVGRRRRGGRRSSCSSAPCSRSRADRR